MAKNEMLVAWLNDAYSMEQSQLKMLERFVDDYEDFPEVQERLRQHHEETERQAQDIKACIEGQGGKVSGVKSFMASAMGTMQGAGTSLAKDEIIKDMLMLHGGEHFEHASYAALVAAAEDCGEAEVATVCRRILDEEVAMAEWTEAQIPVMARAALAKAEMEDDDDDNDQA